MNIKNIALLLLVSCFCVGINAMSQAELITRNFLYDCAHLNSKEHFERIKGGSIGIEYGRKLTALCNDSRYDRLAVTPSQGIFAAVREVRARVNTRSDNNVKYAEALDGIKGLRENMDSSIRDYNNLLEWALCH